MSAIPRWNLGNGASFVVTNEIASHLKLTPGEVLSIGQENINKQKFSVQSMMDILQEVLEEESVDTETENNIKDNIKDNISMIVITTQDKNWGASALLSEDTLKNLHEKIGNFIVLPSNVHEIICIPKFDNFEIEKFHSMVKEVNKTIEEDIFLSDNVYEYTGKKLILLTDTPKLKSQDCSQQLTTSFPKMGGF